ncbi:unnamed protein product [Dovyalis caffra]|uniref:Uncharacterized protein n=1 Tax=Dovyalis caffra TaxID=77055 RepID=A0AAV1RIP5_9ROSI|nr:unnamed protein product [Dovyalis caffra]
MSAQGSGNDIPDEEVQKDIDKLDEKSISKKKQILGLEKKNPPDCKFIVFQGVILSQLPQPLLLGAMTAITGLKFNYDKNGVELRYLIHRPSSSSQMLDIISKLDPVRTWKRRVSAYSGVGLFVSFSGVMLYVAGQFFVIAMVNSVSSFVSANQLLTVAKLLCAVALCLSPYKNSVLRTPYATFSMLLS